MAEFKNPNHQGPGGSGSPGGGSSMLMYISLIALVFLGLQYFFKKPAPAPAHRQPVAATASRTAPAAEPVGPTNSAPAKPAAAGAHGVQASAVAPITVENSLYKITFSNRGGQVTSWILKKYKSDNRKQPLDLVNASAAPKYGYPLSLHAYQPALTQQLATALYVPSSTAPVLHAPASLTYTYAANGLEVKKTFTFDNSYVVHTRVSITRNGAPVAAALAWPSGFGDQNALPLYAGSTFDSAKNGKTDLVEYKKVSGGATLHGDYNWGGVSDLYFSAIFLPDRPANSSFLTLHDAVQIPRNPKDPSNHETIEAPVLGAALGAADGVINARLFVGPKDLKVLSSVPVADGGPSLSSVVSFGYVTIVAKPMFVVLRWIYHHMVTNWGWSILVLTVLLSLLTLPTRITMMRSSLKMQRIQPQMDAIKQRYSKYKTTDPKRQEMNQEIFKLQKDNGVNMFGSCLPMLIQWPLLFGFYRMLENVIELRQAHWLWIPDLSSPDPLHILPVFFVVSMFLVQWLTPSPGVDPKQQKMMAIVMPAVFGFMTWSIGAGLALYWAASNLLGILTQLIINKTSMGREMREIALRRAAKKQGKVINAKVVNARR